MHKATPPMMVARIKAIKVFWVKGMTASDIAKNLPRELKTTRNAIIGMFHRHGDLLDPCRLRVGSSIGTPRAKRKPTQRKPKVAAPPEAAHAPEPEPTPVPAPAPEPEPYIPDEKGVIPATAKPLLLLPESGCRYPYGDRDFVFCGIKQTENSRYCEYHMNLCCAKKYETKAEQRNWLARL